MNLQDSIITKERTKTDLLLYKELISSNNLTTTNSRKLKLSQYRKQLLRLKELPLMKQRTLEWYEARKSRLTASDLDEAIGKSNLKLAKKKAGILQDTTNYTTIPPLKWGTMFEPMATRCYSQEREDIEVHEFGLLADPNLEHFGASPDGINDMGIMIEIKCPYSREIVDNNIPHKYYMQIQGQLAVCGLEECDYIECDFITYDTPFTYIDDIFNTYNNSLTKHGIIAEYKNKDTDEFYYLYSDAYLTASNAYENIKEQQRAISKLKHLTFIKLTPWRLKNVNVQRVTFNPDLWNETIPKINAFWQKVEECKLLPVEETVTVKKQKITFIPDDD
jgi:putative phage-type endonuclease